ncbi:MAG: preprotein translocase subunit SecA [Blautia sp.]|uniref:preprotein translocase subunit SecA n=1 Tax=Blautia sp. TaxID=1955243 RepID=UPI0025C5C26C|nr:preprotein translocase subunit SecA [Blautia sp.]MCI7451151.1 preprotein translocase subunit SecA [Blautia sp.]
MSLKNMHKIVKKINRYQEEMECLTDEQLRSKTTEFKERLQNGCSLDDLLPEAYAVVKEASGRVLHMRPYDVQLLGGIILHQGDIAEMRTGEGKTLVAALPSYLNALEGKGVHVVTVNDYLAARDAEQIGKVHEFLGLTVGVVLASMTPAERKAAYACDITYVTNNELGFDYLRDNMAVYEEQIVQRDLHYAIIDEADSVLIDEARTPLIISGMSGKSTRLYEVCNQFVKTLERGNGNDELSKLDAISGEGIREDGDYMVNEKDKIVRLTEDGTRKVEAYFGIDNLASIEHLELRHHINLALRANTLMMLDRDYVVKDGEVLIVDDFTGRIMPGRRYADGLHQAIEAKEGVEIKRESVTNATITFQSFFNKYKKKSGMTGTGYTERKELKDIYGMDVIPVPTNLPVIRADKEDLMYKTKEEKYLAVVKEVRNAYEKGQPVLIGTNTIEDSEHLSSMLAKEGIPHNVLNAKEHQREAEIVASAGQHHAVTIATNMAGRGTDIKLDDVSRELGGLKIIGTERNESRRIDDQLRGRSGRQGDPGESRFYLSLEDDLMRLFAQEKMMSIFEKIGLEKGEPLKHKSLSKAVRKAQKRIEGNNYSIRKNLMEYDEVMNEQREIIYRERRHILEGKEIMMNDIIRLFISETVDHYLSGPKRKWNAEDIKALFNEVNKVIPGFGRVARSKNLNELKEIMSKRAIRLFGEKAAQCPKEEYLKEVERVYFLRILDSHWMDHIDYMDRSRQGAHLQSYGQRDPIAEYRDDMFNHFDRMMYEISKEFLELLFHTKFVETSDISEDSTEKSDSPKGFDD